MTRASRSLRVSQPTISIAVRRLEKALGTSLLLRGRDGVTLTSTGRELLGRADEILNAVEVLEQALKGLETEPIGQFVIACPDALGAYFLPVLVAELQRKAPQIDLAFWNGASRDVEQAVLRREAHFGLVARAFRHPELVSVELFEDTTDLMVSKPLPRTLDQARERVRRGPLIFVERLPQVPELLRSLAKDDLLPDRRLPCGTLELVKTLGLSGLGVAILPRRVAEYGQPGKLLRLHASLPSIPDTISLIYRSDLHKTRAALLIKSEIVAHAKSFHRSLTR